MLTNVDLNKSLDILDRREQPQNYDAITYKALLYWYRQLLAFGTNYGYEGHKYMEAIDHLATLGENVHVTRCWTEYRETMRTESIHE